MFTEGGNFNVLLLFFGFVSCRIVTGRPTCSSLRGKWRSHGKQELQEALTKTWNPSSCKWTGVCVGVWVCVLFTSFHFIQMNPLILKPVWTLLIWPFITLFPRRSFGEFQKRSVHRSSGVQLLLWLQRQKVLMVLRRKMTLQPVNPRQRRRLRVKREPSLCVLSCWQEKGRTTPLITQVGWSVSYSLQFL